LPALQELSGWTELRTVQFLYIHQSKYPAIFSLNAVLMQLRLLRREKTPLNARVCPPIPFSELETGI
jgi:hypothetical protein